MTRLRGWAPRGERLVDKVPQGKWKTVTFLAALRNDRIDAPCLFDGPINGERARPGDRGPEWRLWAGSGYGRGWDREEDGCSARSCRQPRRVTGELALGPSIKG
jgi:hypothetical protein